MTIKRAQDPWPWPDYPDGMAPPAQHWDPKWSERLLLRPHGRSGGRVYAGVNIGGPIGGSNRWLIGRGNTLKNYLTRAQATRAYYRE